MKKLLFILLLCLCFNSAKPQISDYLTDVSTRDILIEDDYLYYFDYNYFTLEQSINRINLNAVLPSIEIVYSSSLYSKSMSKNGNYFYTSSYNTVSDVNYVNEINLLDTDLPPLQLTSFILAGGCDIAYKSNFIYIANNTTNINRINILSTPPIAMTSSNVIASEQIASYYIDGFILYIGTESGKIYTKNLLLASSPSLIYTSPFDVNKRIRNITVFDNLVYYSRSKTVHRFDPLSIAPTTQTIVESSDIMSWIEGIASTELDSGNKFLYVSDYLNKIIKVNLNDPSLSLNENKLNSISVYPNPATTQITIKTFSEIKNLTFYDVLGKKALSVTPQNSTMETSIDMSTLEKGMYQLKIETGNGVETKKVIKD